ncbi:85/calcium-independent phospholipase A2 [Armadillidium nasatum]|uniref:phospholipase A2 n=1 Tax=Armadillidium nasatum TaxID=96803 RepID=A0A5N5T3B5_9CRUS|nr:85/calcium-independent phospholipase A2 [Armadillidium nasatum]
MVLHVQWSDYMQKHFLYVEGVFGVIALPEVIEENDVKLAYEIIMHSDINGTSYAYSLMRIATKEIGVQVIEEYNRILPCFVESCGKEFFNQSTLQKVLDLLREKPTWLPAHLIAYFGFTDALKHPDSLKSLNVSEEKKGYYALHVAVENEVEKVISQLLNAGASLEVFDREGNSPLHLAATRNISLIQALKPRRHPCLNLKNKTGETPLLLAAKAGKLDNVKSLILFGANLNHEEEVPPNFDTTYYHDKLKVLELSKDISHKDLNKGGSLLHWSKSREMTNLALDLACSPNLLNCQGQTPTHIMVLRSRVSCLMCLLSRGADPNVVNFEGCNPLHLAASIHHITMVQALICFGTKINATNISGETPRHIAASTKVEDKSKLGDKEKVIYLLHAVGAGRCKKVLASCAEGCSMHGSFNGVPLYEKPLLRSRWVYDDHLARMQILEAVKYQKLFRSNLKGRGRVLCLDGGGIKGLVLCQMLDVIKELLGQSITDSFDWISGTSTGGFLALDIATGKSVNHAQALYFSLKDRIFVGNRPYDTKDLENILKNEFGEDTVMSDITRNRISITTTLADRLPADLHMFRNYEAPIDVLGIGESSDFVKPLPPFKQRIWMAARASGAAPTYFSSTDKYLDGGLISNNPVLDTLAEIEEWNMAVRAAGREDEVFTPTVVVSLGCGKPPVVKVDNVDLTVPSILDMRRGFQAMFNMFNLLVEQACASEGRIVDRARSWCSALHVPYFRFNPQLSEDCSIDEHEDAKLVRVMWEARSYMESQSNLLLQLKDFLLNPNISTSKQDAFDRPLPPPRRSVSAPSTPAKSNRSNSSSGLDVLEENNSEGTLNVELRASRTEPSLPQVSSSTQTVSLNSVTSVTSLSSPEDIFYSTDSESDRLSSLRMKKEGENLHSSEICNNSDETTVIKPVNLIDEKDNLGDDPTISTLVKSESLDDNVAYNKPYFDIETNSLEMNLNEIPSVHTQERGTSNS